ncbi:MAG: DNA-3-methyladenine glycosylase 2 family protein [Rhizobiales bacterium]|nr:DNA-3-methyladenine glycosylase 2 family protein [Hyphomicrobiales bacterium]
MQGSPWPAIGTPVGKGQTLDTEEDLTRAVTELVRREPRFALVIERHGPPPLRRSEAGLAGLLRIVTDQLISLKAGAAIWRRIEAELAPFDAVRLARKREASLMRLGLSGAKARCFKSVAKAVADGTLDFAVLERKSDDDVLATLTILPGIGPWTADIYLLSGLGRADAWPAGDLALQAAAHDLLGLGSRPDQHQLRTLAEAWRPHRAVAARLLWSHYRGIKGMSQSVT